MIELVVYRVLAMLLDREMIYVCYSTFRENGGKNRRKRNFYSTNLKEWGVLDPLIIERQIF